MCIKSNVSCEKKPVHGGKLLLIFFNSASLGVHHITFANQDAGLCNSVTVTCCLIKNN